MILAVQKTRSCNFFCAEKLYLFFSRYGKIILERYGASAPGKMVIPMVKNGKTLKLVTCMSMIAALAISALGLSVLATPESTNTSGDQSSDIVSIAADQVGYYEGADGYTKYGDWYGLPYSDWCAMFVSWCADQAGVSTDVFPRFALCSAGADWFISQGRFHYAGTYAPQAGDLIFYASYGNIYHVGLVTGSDNSHVYSIEGNYSEAVYNVSYPLSYGDIMGYATPAYNSGAAIMGSQDEPSVESDAEVESNTESDIESDIESEIESDTESDVEIDTESNVESDTESDVEIDTESDVESDTESDVEIETESDVEIDTESDVEIDTESDVEIDTESDVEIDTDVEVDTESDVEIDTESDTEVKSSTKIVIGDANGDGYVDSSDALLIRRYLLGSLKSSESIDLLAADADASGDITISDALLVLKMSVGL